MKNLLKKKKKKKWLFSKPSFENKRFIKSRMNQFRVYISIAFNHKSCGILVYK